MSRQNKTSLTIVILSYNVSGLLKNCLASVYKTKKKSDAWQVIVVDNASEDDSVLMVKSEFPQVTLMVNSKNLGFSGGNNVALRTIKSEYTLLLNPDTVVYPNSIDRVLKYMTLNPTVGAATCRVELPDGSLDYSCHRKFPDPWNTFIYFFTGLAKKSGYSYTDIPPGIHEIDSLTGAFALIRTAVGKSLNWLDEDYYWNGEDLDFCFRLKKSGHKVIYIPDVKITHYKGSSSGIWKTGQYQKSLGQKIKSVDAGINAMRIFYDKHLARNYPPPFNWFIYTGMFVLRIIRYVKIIVIGSK